MPQDRWLPLEGAANARDLGGLPLLSGGTTVPGRLLRSDTLQELTADDVAVLRRYPVGIVVDLRTPTEAEREGRGPLAQEPVEYVNLPFVPDAVMISDDPAHDIVVADRMQTDRVEHYLDYLRKAGTSVVAALEELARPRPSAVLFHCAAGKDRTGVLAALALEAAGVERDAVLDDYTLTDERLPRIGERLNRLSTYAGYVQRIDIADMRARRETMAEFLDRVDADFGGAAAWMAASGAPDDLPDRLRARLTS